MEWVGQVKPYAPTAVLALLIFYFGVNAVTGDRGLLADGKRDATLATRTAELQHLRTERQDLERRARLLSDGGVSRDLVEERARAVLGFTDPRDYVIRVQP